MFIFFITNVYLITINNSIINIIILLIFFYKDDKIDILKIIEFFILKNNQTLKINN